MRGDGDTGPTAEDRAEVQLALGPDVEQVHPKRDTRGEPGQHEGGRNGKAVGEPEHAGETGLEQRPVDRERVEPLDAEEDRAGDQAASTAAIGVIAAYHQRCSSRRSNRICTRVTSPLAWVWLGRVPHPMRRHRPS